LAILHCAARAANCRAEIQPSAEIANSLILDYHDEIARLEGSTSLREKLVVDAVNYLDAISSENMNDPEFLKESAIAYRKNRRCAGETLSRKSGEAPHRAPQPVRR
jgi:Flp pilus assembly protein TadD